MNFPRAGRFPDRVSAYNKDATSSLTPTALTVGSAPAISVVSNSGLSHSKTSGANTSTVTITGEGITIGKNSASSSLPWDFVGSRLSTYPTMNQILGNSDFFSFTRQLSPGTQMLCQTNLLTGSYSFTQNSAGYLSIGGLFEDGIIYSRGTSDSMFTRLQMKLNSSLDLLLSDSRRTYFGGTENFEIVTSTHIVPTTGINLDYYLIVPDTNLATVAITMNALVQHGQRVTTINKGLAGNTVNGIPLGTSTVTTSYFDGKGWHHFQSPLMAEAALAGGSGGNVGNDATGGYVPPATGDGTLG